MPLTVAIVGRPNVGKSTIFNRLVRKRAAITHDRAGVTRDRIVAMATIEERRVAMVDTGGLEMELGEPGEVREGIMSQAREAVINADAVVLVVDGRKGLTPLDERVAEYVRKSGKPTLLVVNKVDGPEQEHELTAEFHALGLTPMLPVSAEHGFNLRLLREEIANTLLKDMEDPPEVDESQAGLKLAVLGRPNAGKSSLINRLVGENRLLVSDMAGTTRDAVDVTFEKDGKRYTFVDTAGVRRRTKVRDSLERFSVMRALTSAKRSKVSLLVMDAEAGVTQQDKKLLDFLGQEKVPFIAVINKMDLLPRRERGKSHRDFEEALRLVPHVPVIMVSAKTGEGVKRILDLAEELTREGQIRISTGELNRAMRDAITRHQPPQVKYRRAKFYYLTQPETDPPTFVFFVNNPQLIKDSYKRYLENQLRKIFSLKMIPIRIHYRPSHGDKK